METSSGIPEVHSPTAQAGPLLPLHHHGVVSVPNVQKLLDFPQAWATAPRGPATTPPSSFQVPPAGRRPQYTPKRSQRRPLGWGGGALESPWGASRWVRVVLGCPSRSLWRWSPRQLRACPNTRHPRVRPLMSQIGRGGAHKFPPASLKPATALWPPHGTTGSFESTQVLGRCGGPSPESVACHFGHV